MIYVSIYVVLRPLIKRAAHGSITKVMLPCAAWGYFIPKRHEKKVNEAMFKKIQATAHDAQNKSVRYRLKSGKPFRAFLCYALVLCPDDHVRDSANTDADGGMGYMYFPALVKAPGRLYKKL